jgi:hypothetical protein
MISDKPMITAEMLEEWNHIQASQLELERWEHHCNSSEPELFINFFDEWMRTILGPYIREIAPAVALNGACIRTFEALMNRGILMGYFFGCRRFEASIDDMDPSIQIKTKPDKSSPKTGGFSPRDFLL